LKKYWVYKQINGHLIQQCLVFHENTTRLQQALENVPKAEQISTYSISPHRLTRP